MLNYLKEQNKHILTFTGDDVFSEKLCLSKYEDGDQRTFNILRTPNGIHNKCMQCIRNAIANHNHPVQSQTINGLDSAWPFFCLQLKDVPDLGVRHFFAICF